MPTLTIFVGLPGSGKSYAAKQHAESNGLVLFEDAFNIDRIVADGGIAKATPLLASGSDCVIDSVRLTHTDARSQFAKWMKSTLPDVQIEYHYFANDLLNCLKNIIGDAKNRSNTTDRIRAAATASDDYTIPTGYPETPVRNYFSL